MTEKILSQARLKELLDYNPETGLFTHKLYRGGRAKKDDVAGTITLDGYIRISIDGKIYKAHRLAWLYVYGHFPKQEIDHINRVRNDNRIFNLRDVNRYVNARNKTQAIKKLTYPGASWYGRDQRWVSRIRVNGKRIHLGYYDDLISAVIAVKKAEMLYNKSSHEQP